MEQQIKHLEEIKNIFAAHLETKGLRKTPERFAILEEIYSRTDHFDAESLYSHMLKKEYHVSRATVYNTLELLLTCDLITKHQFGKNLAQYEKSYGDLLNFKITHHSLNMYGICGNCQKIREMNEQKAEKTA